MVCWNARSFLVLVVFLSLWVRCLSTPISYGPRPFFLVDDMKPSPVKDELKACMNQTATSSLFSIGHRGAPVQFPEHTRESYVAAARMGAGILECDVTFTNDLELVCRHSQCDLHATTNILLTELASKCSEPFKPATEGSPASAKCCTSDITLAEFKTLTGIMDGADEMASTVEEYINGTPDWRTNWYSSSGATGKLLSHAESVELFLELGTKFTPELKAASVDMPFNGFTQQAYAKKLVDEYRAREVPAEDVWMQSFNLDDVLYWVKEEPRFGNQAVYLDGRYDVESFNHTKPETYEPSMKELHRMGVRIIAPPTWFLLALNKNDKIVPSVYSRRARRAGLDIITWTLERSGSPPSGWYMQTFQDAVKTDGDIYDALDVLARKVKVIGVFTDWPATVTYYGNCFGL